MAIRDFIPWSRQENRLPSLVNETEHQMRFSDYSFAAWIIAMLASAILGVGIFLGQVCVSLILGHWPELPLSRMTSILGLSAPQIGSSAAQWFFHGLLELPITVFLIFGPSVLSALVLVLKVALTPGKNDKGLAGNA